MENVLWHLVLVLHLFVLCLPGADGHLCLIIPRQRGDMDISKGGSRTCFRHGAECGGVPPNPFPHQTLTGGQALFIKWQQNFNHYDIGNPGYMDIAFAVANELSHTASDPFMTLATVADLDQYDQAHQQNYTAVVTLPNIDCDHCVIRARYVAHKPGETTFYQCADVRVTKSTEGGSEPHVVRKNIQLLSEISSSSHHDATRVEIAPETTATGDGENDSKSNKLNTLRFLSKNSSKRSELMTRGATRKQPPHRHRQQQQQQHQHQQHSGDNKVANGELFLEKALAFLRQQRPSEDPRHVIPSHGAGTPANHLFRTEAMKAAAATASNTPDSDVFSERSVRQMDASASATPMAWSTTTSANPKLYGMSNAVDSTNSSTYLAVDAITGERRKINILPFGVDLPGGHYVTDGVMTFDPARALTFLSYNGRDNMEALADRVVEMNSNTGVVQNIYNISAYHKKNNNDTILTSAFNAMVVEIEDSYVTFNIEPDSTNPKSGGFYFIVGRLYRDGSWEELSKTDKLEETYVNFLWADYDIAVKTLYVLLGNENDPYGLSARLYKFFVSPGHPLPHPIDFYSSVDIDMSRFPFMSFHISSQKTNQLFAVSPGTWNQTYPAYHLVVLDVDTGAVKDLGQMTPPGIFDRYYGGAVFNGLNTMTNSLLHVLRVAGTQADVIMDVNVLSKAVRFSQLTNVRNVKNLARPWNVGENTGN